VSALAGRRILLTRELRDCAEWAERVARCGAHAVVLPCIRTEPIDGPALRRALDDAVATADWLVVTSRRGVAAFRDLYAAPLPAQVRVAAVGDATAAAARSALGRADLVGGGTAERLAQTLAAALAGAHRPHVVLAVAANAGGVLTRTLTAAGARCTRCDVYRTVPAPPREPKQALSALGADNIVLASPSAVAGFVHQVQIDAPAAVYTIGPATTAAARAHGLTVAAEAREPSLEGLLEAMQCPR
jgi:uroporphyrinogen-III synthase